MKYETIEELANYIKQEIDERIRQTGGTEEVVVKNDMKNNSELSLLFPAERNIAPLLPLGGPWNWYVSEAEKTDGDAAADRVIDMVWNGYLDFWLEHSQDDTAKIQGQIDRLREYGEVKPFIEYRLINARMNAGRLADMPHRLVEDLAVTCHISYQDERLGGRCSIGVTNGLLCEWGVSEEELFSVAEANTIRRNPPVMTPMESMLGLPYPGRSGLYVLSNPGRIDGAAVVLYPGFLRRISAGFKDDLILIPSSIHEMLMIPWETYYNRIGYPNGIAEIISSVNQSEVEPNEVLSDHPYLYRREIDSIRAWDI